MDDLPVNLRADDAEQAVLGGLLLAPSEIAGLGSLTTGDFYNPHHASIFSAVREAVDSGERVDELVVMEVLRRRGDLLKVGGAPYLHTCSQAIPSVANLGFYARLVQQAATRRKLYDLAVKLRQASTSNDLDDALDVAAQVGLAVTQTADETSVGYDVTQEVRELGAFVNEKVPSHDWIIPGLLERMDRVIVVSGEGAGKTTWARQVAVSVGQGIHPLNPNLRIPPKRCLIVDLENPPNSIRRKARFLVNTAESFGGWSSENVYLWSRPGGINIRKAGDFALLDRVVEFANPSIVFLGPIYKAALAGSDRGEQVAGETAFALDRIREKYGVCLWLEHHAPMEQDGHRRLRPIESGLWSRWPEFGIALRRDGKGSKTFRVERFRGDRDERCWPDELTWGKQWPFEPRWDEGMPGGLHDGEWNRGVA
jgi:hypothetical protein